MEKQQIEPLLSLVALKIGPGWTAEIDDSWPRLKHNADGATLYVHHDKRGRLEFSGGFPSSNGSYYRPSSGDRAAITVADTKTADQIAHDLQRRYLGWYLPEYTKACARMQKDADLAESSKVLGKRLANLAGVEYRESYNGNGAGAGHFYIGSYSVLVDTLGGVRFERLSTHNPEAAEILVNALMRIEALRRHEEAPQ